MTDQISPEKPKETLQLSNLPDCELTTRYAAGILQCSTVKVYCMPGKVKFHQCHLGIQSGDYTNILLNLWHKPFMISRENFMEIDDLYPSKYLRGSDLQGHAVTVKIERVALERFYDQQSRSELEKLVVYLVGKKKALIAGKSLAYEIAGACKSRNTDAWPGQEFVIFTERKLVYGREMDVLRAKAKVAENTAETGF